MNLLTAVKAFFQLKAVAPQLQPIPKNGFLTSEFWQKLLVDAVLVAGVITHFVDPRWAAVISGVLTVTYMVARLILKLRHIDLAPVAGIKELSEEDILSLVSALTEKPTVTLTTTTTQAG